MNNSELKERLKRRGYRVTKDVNGKRVSLTRNEMLNKLGNIRNNNNNTPLNREAHRVRKFIKVCKLILMNINNVRPPRRNNRNNSKKNNNRSNKNKKVVPPPPPPPPRAPVPPPPRLPPVSQNPREALMANLKANLKRRGLSN